MGGFVLLNEHREDAWRRRALRRVGLEEVQGPMLSVPSNDGDDRYENVHPTHKEWALGAPVRPPEGVSFQGFRGHEGQNVAHE